jgi:hypothetical protein
VGADHGRMPSRELLIQRVGDVQTSALDGAAAIA